MKHRILALVMALVIVLIVPMTVFAATDTSLISGTVGATMSVASPGPITLPSLVPGNTVESSVQTVTVITNTNGWSLTVAESGGSPDGKMEKSGPITMANPIKVKGGDLSNYMSLETLVTLKNANGSSGTIYLNNVYFQQQVAANEAAGTYSITVVFTATPGA